MDADEVCMARVSRSLLASSVTPDRNSCSNSITAVKENSVGLGLWRRGMPPVAVYAALQQSGAMPDKEQPRLPTKLPVAVVSLLVPSVARRAPHELLDRRPSCRRLRKR